MAEKEIHNIIKHARQRWELRHVAIAHRTGVVPCEESSVEIAVSSAHRREALEAVAFAIDELKARVPIWKKEVYAGDNAPQWKENADVSIPTLAQLNEKASASQASLRMPLAIAAATVTVSLLAHFAKRP
jgi:molybdopterin synthase catalytic subunit